VNWNGRALATSFVSSVQLTATVPASLIAKAGTASVTIRTPPPGGGSSNPVFFPVRRPVKSFKFQESSAGNPNDVGGSLVMADFNRDGILDFASFGIMQLAVSLGNGDGTFQSPTMFSWPCAGGQAVAADFNGDGLVDLAAVCGGVYIYLGNGDGTFQNPVGISTQTDNVALAAGDLNRDGKMDLVLAGSGVGGNDDLREITVLLGKGDGTFRAPRYVHINRGVPGGTYMTVTTADINQDGNLDLIAISDISKTHRGVFVLLGKGDGTFFKASRLTQAPHTPSSLVLADFNADGKLDLAITSAIKQVFGRGEVFALAGNGDGTFGPGIGCKTPGKALGGIAIGDFNGDGLLDLATVANNYPENPLISVLRGVGDGTFMSDLVFKSTLSTGQFLAVGDFNDDGKLDLLLGASADFGGVDVYLQVPR
jgi:hypothetical protein